MLIFGRKAYSGPRPLAYAVYAFINVDNCERPLNDSDISLLYGSETWTLTFAMDRIEMRAQETFELHILCICMLTCDQESRIEGRIGKTDDVIL